MFYSVLCIEEKIMKKSIRIASFLILLIVVLSFALVGCAHRDAYSYKEGVYSFKRTAENAEDELLLSDDYDLHIEEVSMTFKKIGLIEFNKAKYKNVIKNSGDLKKYHVDLYIKFAEEEEGRYYDFYSDDTIMFEHPIIIHLKNEQLGLDIEKEFVMGLDSEEEVFFLWYSDAPHNGKINDIPLLLSKN